MATESLSEMAKILEDEILKVRGACQDTSLEIEEHLKSKANARKEYDSALDRGDESGMASCLRVIKEANKAIEILKLRYEVFSQKLPALHERHEKMRVVKERNIKAAAETLKEARELKKSCDDEQNLCLGMLDKLNGLRNLIDKEFGSFGKI